VFHSSLRSTATALIGITVMVGCRAEKPHTDSVATAAAATPHQMTIVARNYSFEAPDTVPAGLTSLTLTNEGTEFHHATLIRLGEGKTIADLSAAMAEHGPPPSWVMFVGGSSAPEPGRESTITTVFTPGTYAMICFIPSSDGVPHFAKGMIKGFTVVPDPSAPTALPEADIVVSLTDYDFTFSAPLTAGQHRILIRNDGPQIHEMYMAKLEPGKTLADFLAWAETLEGPAPSATFSGVANLSAGQANLVTVDVTPGDYVLICFVPDAADGKPHLAHGMAKQITVS